MTSFYRKKCWEFPLWFFVQIARFFFLQKERIALFALFVLCVFCVLLNIDEERFALHRSALLAHFKKTLRAMRAICSFLKSKFPNLGWEFTLSLLSLLYVKDLF